MSAVRHTNEEARIPRVEAAVYHSLSRHPGSNTVSDYFLQAILTP